MRRTTHQSEKGVIYIRQKRPTQETYKKNLPAKKMMMQCKGRHIITRRAYMYYTKETYKRDPQKRPTKETYKTKWRCNANDDTSIREGRIFIIQKRPIKETYKTKWRCNAKNDTSIREGRIYMIHKRTTKESLKTKWLCNAKNDTSIWEG